jgi:rhodanese-related sulfurtransferase
MTDGIDEISPSEALSRQTRGALLIDVREDDERAGGTPAGALGVPLAEVAARIAGIEARHERDILTICASGKRSLRAAQALRDLGYTHLASVSVGTRKGCRSPTVASAPTRSNATRAICCCPRSGWLGRAD